jgi:hemerythrin superfamily protein
MTDPFSFNNAVDLLDADHKLVQSMFLEYDALCEEGASDEVRQTLAERICREIAIHAQIEEEIFYPAVREALDDDELIEEALEEHAEAKELIAHIHAMEPSSDDYDATVKALAEAIDEHVVQEREEIFEQAKFAPLDLRGLAAPLQLRKQQLKAATESRGRDERPTAAA